MTTSPALEEDTHNLPALSPRGGAPSARLSVFALAAALLLEHAVDLVLVLELEVARGLLGVDALPVEQEAQRAAGHALALGYVLTCPSVCDRPSA